MRMMSWIAMAVLVALPTAAQVCDDSAQAGNFDVVYEGAEYDGSGTEFTYCVTGLDVPGFHALSNWGVALGVDCVEPGDITGCSPEPCYYQVDDPNLGITGIKFDDVEVEKGETECYSFTLAGDWTDRVGTTEIALKAAQDISTANICGPVCEKCSMELAVEQPAPGLPPDVKVRIVHNRPPVVLTKVWYGVRDSNGDAVHLWSDGPVTLLKGSLYSFDGPIPGLSALAPGEYQMTVGIHGMAGWYKRSVRFHVQ